MIRKRKVTAAQAVGGSSSALEEVRIGAVADGDGRISRWRPA
jgi:hypothetical protein